MSRAIIAERATHASERAKELLNSGGSVVSKARSLVMGDAQFFAVLPKIDELRGQLNSDSVSEKRDAMKRIIAQICKGVNMAILFPDVVKNIHIPSMELRKLIYFFVAHYAEDRPDVALLAISAFMEGLVDPSMYVRSLSLRMITSIRVPAIHPVAMLTVKKMISDYAPLVRKAAALALAQLHSVSGQDYDKAEMRELMQQLLSDKSCEVVAAAAFSMMEICPTDYDLIHCVFRKICCSLHECDEWGQTVLLRLLLRYARSQFTDPDKPPELAHNKERSGNNDEDSDDGSSNTSSSDPEYFFAPEAGKKSRDKVAEATEKQQMNPDLRLLLESVKPLMLGFNSGVVVSAAALFFHCAPRDELYFCVKPLINLLHGSLERHVIVLGVIQSFVVTDERLFIPYYRDFFLFPGDVPVVCELKVRILSKLATPENFADIFREFRSYVRSFDSTMVVQALHGLALMSARIVESSTQIMRLIVPLLSHKNTDVVSEAVTVLRQLVVQGSDKAQSCRIVHRLLQQVISGEITTPSARASVLWLVGENLQVHSAIAASAPDCFRIIAKNFKNEDSQVKKQGLTLGCKIWLCLDGEGELAERFKNIFFYVLDLVRYDEDYDVRDRGRIIECAVERGSDAFTALKATLLAPKPLPQANDPFKERVKYELGTLSHYFGTSLFDYEALQPWPLVEPSPNAREPPKAHRAPSSSSSTSGSGVWSGSSDAESDESSATEDSDEAESVESTTVAEEESSSDSGTSSSSASKVGRGRATKGRHATFSSSDSDDEVGARGHGGAEQKTTLGTVRRPNIQRVIPSAKHVEGSGKKFGDSESESD